MGSKSGESHWIKVKRKSRKSEYMFSIFYKFMIQEDEVDDAFFSNN